MNYEIRNKNKKDRGFTLIELMVATSIFMVIMLMALGALVSTSDSAKKAQANRTAIDNVSFAMESMTRSLRMGSEYNCLTSLNFSLGVDNSASGLPHDCPISPLDSSGGSGVMFTSSDHKPGDLDTAYILAQRIDPSGGSSNSNVLQRCSILNYSTVCVDMVSADVNIEQLKFFVNGAESQANSNFVQPSVYIIMKGTITVKGESTTFTLQTMASQRSVE